MIYPKKFEDKIGFTEIRQLLRERGPSPLGKEEVDQLSVSYDARVINNRLRQVSEFRHIQEMAEDFPLRYFYDVRPSVQRIRLEGTHLEEPELFDLRRSLETIGLIVAYLHRDRRGETSTEQEEETEYLYPTLQKLASEVRTFPELVRQIDQIIDKYGKIKDNASADLLNIRRELAKTEGSVSRALNQILRAAQSEGLVDKDSAPTIRDGRLVIPVAPAMKRKIRGIVHDESATGKTVYIEPAEVVEANNRIRELEAEERREVIRILKEMSATLRPHVPEMLQSYQFLAQVDLIRAKAELARLIKGIEPQTSPQPYLDWIQATHPLLRLSLERQNKKAVPLDIMLTPEKRMLIISGPNAGGKSVCLKTVGLLQYMLQCGLSIPLGERSRTGVFRNIMIDIGDEQSIENDLSTYSSHLLNMKNMMKYADDRTLLLIDEFGSGTEPQMGGAIAESVLRQFWKKATYAVITTHYQNLKHFAEDHDHVVNGAMLYDRHEMRPLFQLQIGQPGSSFAIEIARKTGLPEEVINDASQIVGSEYIQSDKYLQDIVRDKRYWENKRQTIHQREKSMEQTISRYEEEVRQLQESRRQIIAKAKEQAEELLAETNRRIENTIREIRESQAEKEETRRLREQLNDFKKEVLDIDSTETDELISKKIRQIQERKERRERRKQEKANKAGEKSHTSIEKTPGIEVLAEGDTVRIKGLTTVGRIESIQGKMATVVFGDMRTKMRAERLEHAQMPTKETPPTSYTAISRQTRETIDDRKLHFKQDLDVRGMRGDEAINAVTYFIDDAILVGMSRVRILHGTGGGILRQLIRQYLATVPNVNSFRDEHVQFGGAGITVVDLD
ncbi:MAG: Smr/MutS family protein [Prevotella sp.]|nr:Smr/MutS family protein [Prevotella sp.]